MKISRFACASGLAMSAFLAVCTSVTPASAAGLQAGEYSCIGSGGRILIGMGFRLDGSGRYVSLDNTKPGQVVDSGGSTVTFKGGILNGYVGTDVKSDSFNVQTISCRRIH